MGLTASRRFSARPWVPALRAIASAASGASTGATPPVARCAIPEPSCSWSTHPTFGES